MKKEMDAKYKRWKEIRDHVTKDYELIHKVTGLSISYIEKMFSPSQARPINELALVAAELIVADRKASVTRIKQQIKEALKSKVQLKAAA